MSQISKSNTEDLVVMYFHSTTGKKRKKKYRKIILKIPKNRRH